MDSFDYFLPNFDNLYLMFMLNINITVQKGHSSSKLLNASKERSVCMVKLFKLKPAIRFFDVLGHLQIIEKFK